MDLHISLSNQSYYFISISYPLVQSLNSYTYLLSTYCVPGIEQGPGDTMMKKHSPGCKELIECQRDMLAGHFFSFSFSYSFCLFFKNNNLLRVHCGKDC